MGNDLGKRHECFSCRTKFYDLLRERAVCPKCGSDQEAALKAVDTGPGKTSKGKKGRRAVVDIFDTQAHNEEDDPVKDGDISIDLKAGL